MSPDPRVRTAIFCLVTFAATASGAAAPSACPEHLQFLGGKCAQWQASILPPTPPAARGNALADNDGAAALGMKIFYDNRFSKQGSGVACVNCHDPEHSFAEDKPTSNTIRKVTRNAPSLLDAAWYRQSHFWDGKVDNLWSAPLFTFEQEAEMGSSRLQVVHTLAAIYKIRYEKIFGTLPDFSDVKRFPPSGKPGDPAFDTMSKADKDLINQVYANAGKAIEAYVRKLAAGRSRFDDFISGSARSFSVEAQRGMTAFTRYGCDTCHSGPTFTDEGFHNLGNAAQAGAPRDPARAGGATLAAKWAFTAASRFADPLHEDVAGNAPLPDDPRGFRTPSLRNVDLSPPYGHDGSFSTLAQAIDAHRRVLPGHVAPNVHDKQDIIAFLHSLDGRPPLPPWNYWPGG